MSNSFLDWATIDSIANISESTIQYLLSVSAIGGVVVILAILLQAVLNKFIAAKWIYLFWILVVARFVLFSAPESPTSFLNLISQPEVAQSTTFHQTEIVWSQEPTNQSTQAANLVESETLFVNDVQEHELPNISAWHLAFLIWMIGFAWAMKSLIVGYRRVRKLIAASVNPPEELNQLFEKCIRNTGAVQNINVLVSDELQVPAMAGIFKPIILIPRWCEREMSEQELEMVITHELIHIRRMDGLIQLLTYSISAIHWFNPLAKIAVRFVESARELSCDQQVINSLELNHTTKRFYGELILNIATRASNKPVCAVFLGGFIGTNNCLIKQRIAMLVQPKSTRRLGTLIAAMAVVTLIAGGFTAAQTDAVPSAQQKSKPEPQQQTQSTPPSTKTPTEPTPTVTKNEKASTYSTEIELTSGQSIEFRNCKVAPKFKVKDPEIAELVFVEDTGLELNGVRPGNTSFEITETNGDTNTYSVRITPRPTIKIVRGKSKRIDFLYQVPSIVVPEPETIEVSPTSPTSMLVNGKKYGNATIVVSNGNRNQEIINCEVVANTSRIQKGIAKVFPGSKIEVDAFGGTVILEGYCKPEKAAEICKWTRETFDVTKVVNQCTAALPVAIKVKVYEVSSSKMADLGIDWSILNKKGKKFNTMADLVAGASNNQKAAGKNMSFGVMEGTAFSGFVEALEKHAIIKLLDQPVLVANPGKSVDFLSGGEIPIAVVDKNGNKAIEFRAFGTKLNATVFPTGKDELKLQVRAELSELAEDLKSADGVPGFRIRRVNTGVQMKYGETLAISCTYKEKAGKKESELLFMLTPRTIERVAQKESSPAK